MTQTFVVVPTYNESANIARIIAAIFESSPGIQVLVVDDRSPDGTSDRVRELIPRHPGLHLLTRHTDRGRGTAGIAGFALAMQLGAQAILEMDADFSHPPTVIPALLEGLRGSDIVIASRLLRGSRDRRPWARKLITTLGNRYVRFFLERPGHSRVRDWTTGFRAYRRSVFEKLPPEALISRGPSILQEILYRALQLGSTASEIPFEMVDREHGVSSFNSRIARQSLLSVPCYRILFSGEGKPFCLPRIPVKQSGERAYIAGEASGSGHSR